MKNPVLSLAFFLSAVAPAALVAGLPVNVLDNPGFEADDASGGDVTPVTDWPGFEQRFATELEARTGSNSLLLVGPGTQFAGSSVSQTHSSGGGRLWKLTAWLYTPSAAPLSGDDFGLMKIKFSDGGGTIKEMEAPTATAASLPQNTWTQFTVESISPTGTTGVEVELLFVQLEEFSDGEVYFDDVVLEDLGPVTAPDPGVLSNAGFEADDASAFDFPGATGWGKFNDAFTVSAARDIPKRHASYFERQSLKIFGPFFPEGGAGVAQGGFAAKQGDIWTARASALNLQSDPIQGDNFAVVKLEFFDAGSDKIGEAESAPVNASTPTQTWVERSVSEIAPPNTATVQIVLVHVQKNDPVTGGSVFFDDAGLEKTGELAPITSIIKSGNTATLIFDSMSGSSYNLLKSTTGLEVEDFSGIQFGIPGNGGDATGTDSNATEDAAFYFVNRILP